MSQLTEFQKALCYFFVCEGLIDNSGFFCILLETKGEFSLGYANVLGIVGEQECRSILGELHQIYQKFEDHFSRGNLPSELDDESKRFDRELREKIDTLERKWYQLTDQRVEQMSKYLELHKNELVTLDGY